MAAATVFSAELHISYISTRGPKLPFPVPAETFENVVFWTPEARAGSFSACGARGGKTDDKSADLGDAMTNVTDYTALVTNNSWNGFGFAGQACVVTYSFGSSPPSYVTDGSAGFAPGAGASYEAYTAVEKTAARAALAQWAAVCGISFVEVPSGGDLAFHKVDLALTPNPDSGGFAIKVNRGFFLGGNGVDESLGSDGDVFIDAVNTPTGTNLAYALLHEIGHTLGFKHPFDGDPLYSGATTAQTVMAYGAAVTSLGTLDPQAARALYGNDTPAANTLLSFSYDAATAILSQTWGTNGNSILGTSSKDSINAGGGNDRVGGLGDTTGWSAAWARTSCSVALATMS